MYVCINSVMCWNDTRFFHQLDDFVGSTDRGDSRANRHVDAGSTDDDEARWKRDDDAMRSTEDDDAMRGDAAGW